MADGSIGSLKVSLSLDSADFNKSMASIDRDVKTLGGELSTLRAKGKDWGQSLEGLTQRQDALGRTMKAQGAKVKKLREEYEKSAEEKGKDAKVTQNLAKKLNKAVSEYTRTETELNEVNESLSKQQAALKKARSPWNKLSKAVNKAGDKLQKVGQGVKDAGGKMSAKITAPLVGGLAAVTKGTEETRESLARLEQNAESAGLSTKNMKQKLVELSGVTGDSQANVEALSNLMATEFDKEGLSASVDALSGAVVKFPNTLKIESLSDSLQETVSTGKAVGQFGELLDRVGVNTDKFSDGLQKAKENGEAQQYVLETLADTGLTKVNEQYRKNNEELVKSREAQAKLQQSTAKLGETLAPIMTKITEAITQVVEWFNKLSPAAKKVTIAVSGVAAAIGPLLAAIWPVIGGIGKLIPLLTKMGPVLTAVRTAFTALTGPIGLTVAAVTTLATVIYKNWDKIEEVTIKTWESVKTTLKNTWESIKKTISNAWNGIKNITESVWNGIKSFFKSWWNAEKKLFKTVTSAIKKTIETVWNTIKNVTKTVWNGIKSFFKKWWNGIKTLFKTVTRAIKETIETVWNTIKSVTETVWNGIKSFFQSWWKAEKKLFKTVTNAIKDTITSVWNAIKSVTKTVWNAIKSFFTTTWNAIKSTFTTVTTKIKNTLSAVWDSVTETIKTVWNSIKSFFTETLTSIWNTIKTKFTDMYNSIKAKMNDAWDKIEEIWGKVMDFFRSIDLKQIGKDIIQGLINGIGDMKDAVVDKAKEIGNGVKDSLKSLLGIESPSKVTTEYGQYIGEGFIIGMSDKEKDVGKQSSKLAEAVTKPLKGVQKVVSDTVSSINSLAKSSGGSSYVSNTSLPGSSSNTLHVKDDGSTETWEEASDSKSFSDALEDTRERVHSRLEDEGKSHKDKYTYHSGGLVKKLGRSLKSIKPPRLDSDEVPAILQTGEFVLSRKMMDGIKRMGNQMQSIPGGADNSRTFHQTNNFYSPEPISPSDAARKMKRTSRQLAAEWGMN